MRKPSIWNHKKYGKKEYTGRYGFDMKTGRVFVLMGKLSNGKDNNIVFESHESAKALGWKKIR